MTQIAIVESHLRTSMQQIWSAYMDHDLIEAEFGPLEAAAPIVRGQTQIAGAWEGRLRLECSEALARNVAAAMFGLPAELLTIEKVHDALGEVTNMLGGCLKHVLPPPVHLSIPIVEELVDNATLSFDGTAQRGHGISVLGGTVTRRNSPKKGNAMKILIVDDSKGMRMIVSRALRQADLGTDIIEASSGSDALRLLQSTIPDVVLCDWNMPEMSGLELLEQIKGRGITVKFGFVTSESTPAMRAKAMDAGALFLISKPFTNDAFAEQLRPVLAS